MTPTTYGRDFAYCLKSHGGVRGFYASLWRFLLRCTLFCHSVATFLTSVSSYEGGCGFEEKNFFVVNREDGLNTRMKDLLQKYGILDRLISVNVTNQGLCSDIDYSKANELLNRDIKLSMTYLANNLK